MQHKMIYFPRSYDAIDLQHEDVVDLNFVTGEGKQTVFYYPPPANPDKPPAKLWVVFGGNASLALDWYDFVSGYPDKEAGFLMVDYPGYGKCQGTASPDSILESSRRAMSALAAHLAVDDEQLIEHLRILGHSLGAAAGLQFAVQYPVKEVVLISPFTSLRDMAEIVVGRLLAKTLLDNFDNRARLAELAAWPTPPAVHLFHGNRDDVVPVRMGRELAELYPHLIAYHEIDGGDHNRILTTADQEIYQAMENIRTM